ncbi:TIGR03808 family TAT-translocated repetitive protein [Rhizobium tumorigenes]|uniref:TIGR03808 family TAT-translocated repetitive protein n=1 Tax=Rhizobium tumorigenes TaxID=2041385 RepID=A0AAF1K5D6_9HYPH|nr:TIGR03808 family TAT-translocated repetitive protein [Rhizobium tumorigenes]WFR96134.1 TIGR03808 family TAT-translocated repetitive protein [Rhizobium tumorigenes]
MISRRELMVGAFAAAASAGAVSPHAFAAPLAKTGVSEMRGAIDGVAFRKRVAADGLQSMIDAAARDKGPVMLPAGNYTASNLTLPDNTRLIGVPGATRIVYGGGGFLMNAADAGRIEISGVVIDGGNLGLAADAGGLLRFNGVGDLLVSNCEITGSAGNGLHLERCGGRIERNRIAGAANAGVYAVQSNALTITGNRVEDCGNGGILVHRWQKGEDGSVISGNRIARIGARDGGTGENGNGINVYYAGNVMVTDNHIADCAFTAVRANSASDVQISDNQCLRSGETAIFCEFEFEGAVVSGNLIDGAANGIAIANFDKGGRLASVTGNVVRNLSLSAPYAQDGGFGIGISAEADTLISGNVIENAPLWGIKLGWGPYMRNLVASGNIVRNAPVGCAVSVANGAGSAVISNNLFEAASQGAIVAFLWDKPASADLVTGSTAYPQLTILGNRLA